MSRLLSRVVDRAAEEMDRRAKAASYFDNPALWAEYMLDMHLWSRQKEIAQSVVHNKSVAVKTGHGVGKSLLAAVLICWWIDTRFPNVFVASTAPSVDQIGGIVWREVRRLKDQIAQRFKDGDIDHELPGYITADNQWKLLGGTLLAFGRKPPENKEDDSFQGLHDAYVLAIGDEACGLSGELIDALGNITANEDSRRLLIANPTNPASYFGKIFKNKPLNWILHSISVLDSPNFTSEKKEMSKDALAKLVGPQYVEDKKAEYGEDSARYKARVLGEFAYDAENTLITPADIDKAIAADAKPSEDARPTLGVDVARMGDDRSCIYSNTEGKIRFVDAWTKSATTETANRVHRHAIDLAAIVVFVDADGVGGGVKDQLVQLANGAYIVIEVHGSGSSPDRRQWHNFRSYAWDSFRLRCSKSLIDLAANDEDLHDELMPVRYLFNKQSGGLLIESKEDMKERGMKSPDLADAAIYASIEFDLNDPFLGLTKGDKLRTTPEDMLSDMPEYLRVMRNS